MAQGSSLQDQEMELQAQLDEANDSVAAIEGELGIIRSMTFRNPDFGKEGRYTSPMSRPKEMMAYSQAKIRGVVPADILENERALKKQLTEANKQVRRIQNEVARIQNEIDAIDSKRFQDEFSDLAAGVEVMRGTKWGDTRAVRNIDDEEDTRNPSRKGTETDGFGPGVLTPRKRTPYRNR